MATAEEEHQNASEHDDTTAPTTGQPQDKKRKRRSKSATINDFSIRDPPWTYLHLRHHNQTAVVSSTRSTPLDETTVSMFVDAALGQFLGLHGRAIQMDILKLDADASDVWVRIPRADRPAFMAALSGWIGRNGDALRVVGWSSWDANAMGRDAGQDLFGD